MSTHRHIDAICVAVLVLTLLATVLFINGEAFGLQVIVDEDAETFVHLVPFTENDKNGAWDTSRATVITLNGDYASVFGGGAYAYGGNVFISSAGKYILSGTLDDGSIIVDTNSTAKVWIMLNGVSVSCSDGACLVVEQADKVFLSLADGAENSMDTHSFSVENQAVGMDGALFSRDDLTINGSGSLTVTSAVEHGIVCNDELVITGGKITVNAAADALHVNDNLRIMTAELELTAGDDGISLTGPESELYFESGMLSAQAVGDGINAGNNLRILGGTLALNTGDDGISLTGPGGEAYFESGMLSVKAGGDGINGENGFHILGGTLTLDAGDDGISAGGVLAELQIEAGSLRITALDKGISAENVVRISGGTVEIESADDGISAVGDVFIENGELTINAADDGIHSDAGVWISGGTIRILGCYEGIEAVTIDISGGEITIYPEDDGMNANGAADISGGFGGMLGGRPNGIPGGNRPDREQQDEMQQNGFPEPPDGNNMQELSEPPTNKEYLQPEGSSAESPAQMVGTENTGNSEKSWIRISGGSITVINSTARDADGLDSNGDIIISGGVIRVSLTNSGSNSALDYGSESGGVMEISGGEVIACGSYAMAEGFSASSTQCGVLYNTRRGAAAGTVISLEDNEGNVILSYEVPCSFSSVAISCPEMQIGETYVIVIGDTAEEITLEDISASFGDAQSEHFGGPMNWGGMHFRPGRSGSMREERESEPRNDA